MRVVHVAAEHAAFAHSGGLGEVVAALAAAQARQGAEVRVLVPSSRPAADRVDGDLRPGPEVWLPWAPARFSSRRAEIEGTSVDLLFEPALFDRDHLYGLPGGEYSDNPVRFTAFCRAVADIVTGPAAPDVVHLHDWHSGLVAPMLSGRSDRPATVFTVHNPAYQGDYPADAAVLTALAAEHLGVDGVMHNGRISPLKAGVQIADIVATVSPTHARELLDPRYAFGLEGAYQWRSKSLHGVINGIAPNGPALSASGRRARRRTLCRSFGLTPPKGPLLGVVSRLTWQKGIDLLAAALPFALDRGAAAIILGAGDAELATELRALQRRHPAQVAFVEGFKPVLADRLFGACDFVCIPSRYEPCGLVQMHAMRKGALPLARRTGGLADTIADVDEGGYGILFDDPTIESLRQALERAFDLLGNPNDLAAARRLAKEQDFGWEGPAGRYIELYEEAMRVRDRDRL
jgi:starch synthase